MSTDRQGRSGLGLDAQKDAVQQRLNGGRWQRLFADLPELNGAMGRFMLTTVASVAELEAGLISERTKVALKPPGHVE